MEKTVYNPNIFEIQDIEEAKKIILTNEKNTSTNQRWENETPYIINSISSKVKLSKNSLVVDFGCGIGRLSKELITKYNCQVIGVDISGSMRKHAISYVDSNRFQAVSPQEFKSILYKGVRFDMAIAVWVLQHCIDPIVEISLLRSSLKKDAPLYVLNNINMAIPTNKGWVTKDIDIFYLLEKQFELQIKSKIPHSAGSEHIAKHTYEAFYTNNNFQGVQKELNLLLKRLKAFQNKKDHKSVLKIYDLMIKLDPLNFNLYNSLGIYYEKLALQSKAIDAYKMAVKINPKFSKAINNIAVILYNQKKYDQSAAVFQIALDVDPNYFEVYSNMGAALNKAKKYEEAIKALKTAIEKLPNHSGAYTNLGNVYNKLHDYKKAAFCHEKSIQLDPSGYNAYSNVGTSYKYLGLTNKAIESYKKACELKSDFENAHFDLSTVYLAKGDFVNGLKEYEWRFKKDEMKSHILKHKHIFSRPMMKKGEDIKDKTLLVHSEQGFGDSIMYARFLPQLKAMGCRLAVECRDELKTLFETMNCIDIVVGRDENKTPQFDIHLPIMSCAYVLDIKSIDDFPSKPYFNIDDKNEFELKDDKIKIGICWSASSTGESYDGKVFDLINFAPLFKEKRIQVYSLQVGHGSEQIVENNFENDIIDLTSKLTDFKKTAMLIKQLDLVITSDTSVAHLSGAIGAKTYTLLQKYPDWRWLYKGVYSYLYPSMRLFRQKQNRNWESVFQSLFDKLNKEYKLKLKR